MRAYIRMVERTHLGTVDLRTSRSAESTRLRGVTAGVLSCRPKLNNNYLHG